MSKKITLSNKEVLDAYKFLQNLTLSAKASRGRSKLLKRLEEKNKEFNEDLKELQNRYFDAKEDGSFKTAHGMMLFKEDVTNDEKEEYSTAYNDLFDEKVVIEFGEYSKKYEDLFDGLENLTQDISGENANIYDKLLDEYEANKEEK